ncbi:MAG: hypothetical protein WA996_02320 [Candidatus Promineifilaceae bacterium]
MVVGENLTYDISLSNTSTTTATSIVVTDTLPTGVDYVFNDSGVMPNNPSPGVYEWSLPDIPAAMTYTFNLTTEAATASAY